jgi:regulator of sirC expression with transglutaminase-like and TPR domain
VSDNTTLTTGGSGRGVSPSQREALLRLLDDEDPAVYRAVRQRIEACGEEALDWLQPQLRQRDPRVRRRVEELIEVLTRKGADSNFLAFCLRQGEDFELEPAVWQLAAARYPGINQAAYQALLDSYAADLQARTHLQPDARGSLGCLNDLLFNHLGYRGNEADYYDPDNSYLNRVVDRRTGNPISLCLLYWFVARRLRLPVTGVGMPGHFLCRYQSPTEELFIDAFNQGRFLSKADCVRYLAQTSHGFQEGMLAPCSPRRVLLRISSNLHQIHLHHKNREEAARYQRYVVALSR